MTCINRKLKSITMKSKMHYIGSNWENLFWILKYKKGSNRTYRNSFNGLINITSTYFHVLNLHECAFISLTIIYCLHLSYSPTNHSTIICFHYLLFNSKRELSFRLFLLRCAKSILRNALPNTTDSNVAKHLLKLKRI